MPQNDKELKTEKERLETIHDIFTENNHLPIVTASSINCRWCELDTIKSVIHD